MPDCRRELSFNEGAGIILGEMAHIRAEKPGELRWDPTLTTTQRNSYSNLMLLCPTHHTEIDQNPAKWTVERLLQIKSEHEEWVTKSWQPQLTESQGKLGVFQGIRDMFGDFKWPEVASTPAWSDLEQKRLA